MHLGNARATPSAPIAELDAPLSHEATMSEWMPVLLGAVLGALHLRHALSRRSLVVSALVAAALATTLSGEWSYAPYLVVVDAMLVGAGILASRAAHRAWTAYTARRPT
jgi:hypothetical protein